MSRICGAILVTVQILSGAALAPLSGPTDLPKWTGIEENKGQASLDVLGLARGMMHAAITARGVMLGTWRFEISYVSGKPATVVSLDDPLPGRINVFQGPENARWFRNIRRFRTIDVGEIYPGIRVGYRTTDAEELLLTLKAATAVETRTALFEAPHSVTVAPGQLTWRFGPTFLSPVITMSAPRAFQVIGTERLPRLAKWITGDNDKRFAVAVEDADPSKPVEVEILLPPARYILPLDRVRHTEDSAGNRYWIAPVPDSPASRGPFLESNYSGCSLFMNYPVPCTDVAVYRYTRDGELSFASFLSGNATEFPTFITLTRDGSIVVAGNTDSEDFPVGARAYQPRFGGAEGKSDPGIGDYFAARIDSATGQLTVATYLGGPYADYVGAAALASDGSIHFIPQRRQLSSGAMPTSTGILQPACLDRQCTIGYTAKLGANLDRLIYGTYLPGSISSAQVHSDDTLYVGGRAAEGGFVAHLNESATRLLFRRSVEGTPNALAVAPDGSVWVGTSYPSALFRFSSDGSRAIAEKPINHITDLAADNAHVVHVLLDDKVNPSSDAPLTFPCGGSAYIRLNGHGDQLFATYLGFATYFDGFTQAGNPRLNAFAKIYELTQDSSTRTYAGCLVDSASLAVQTTISPGGLVTIFGQQLGPQRGVSYTLESGAVPTTLGGTRVLVNGEPAPILYSSSSQVNFIVPYSMQVGRVQVVGPTGLTSDLLASFAPAMLTLFSTGAAPFYQAAALNEDGTLNSPQNPARKGSHIVLYGTGAGQTTPPSVAGEIIPLEPRPAKASPLSINGVTVLPDYIGAAPGLISGVTQINVRLPADLPELTGELKGRARIVSPQTPQSFVTISVTGN